MQVFRELFIRGEPDQLAATAKAICDSISGDWSRDLEAEARSRQSAYGLEHVYSFKCQKPELRSAVNLFLKGGGGDLCLKGKYTNTLYVTNIVPQEVGQLSYDEYNGVMEEFYRLFVQPAVARTGADTEMTEADADLERWLSPEAAKKLRDFCFLTADRMAHRSDPDERRQMWRDFIILAHREGTDLDSTTLARWLHEDGHLREEWADALAGEYASGRQLLARAEKQAVGV